VKDSADASDCKKESSSIDYKRLPSRNIRRCHPDIPDECPKIVTCSCESFERKLNVRDIRLKCPGQIKMPVALNSRFRARINQSRNIFNIIYYCTGITIVIIIQFISKERSTRRP